MQTTQTQARADIAATGSETIADLLPLAAAKYGDRAALTTKRGGEWATVTYGEIGTIVREIALGLLDLGLAKGDRVAILCTTRPEWTYADFAISTAGGTVVPIYPTNSAEECEWVLADSESKIVVCGDRSQLAKVIAIRDRLVDLERVIVLNDDDATGDVISINELRARGRAGDVSRLEARTASVSPQDTYTIIYTSGTTGRPKGCVLSHRNYRASLDSVNEIDVIRPDDVTYLFLPLAHALSLLIQLASFDVGAMLAYWGGDPSQVVAELREVKPTYFPSVPRMFEKIHGMAAPAIKAQVGEDRFDELVALGVEVRDLEHSGQEVPIELRRKWDPIDERVFANVRSIFGGRIREAATGAAPISKDVLEFFYAAGIPVLEGFGMTETSTGVSASTPEHHKFGSVGRALPGVELKIADDGEILVRGDNVFEGYYKNPQATADALVGGWLRTGDLGTLDQDGYLSITGRKKDIIITAGGKNLTPSNLENDMKQCRYISQAMMHGDRRPFPTMLITLDPDEIAAWAKERGEPQDSATLARNPEVIALIQAALDQANSKYAPVEQVKKFFILDHDLSQEAGELTPTMKVKRSIVNERYATQFDELY